MAFISMQGISLSFSGVQLFDGINLTIERGEKIGLAGRKKALAEHTWEKRWREILEVCR